MLFFVKTGRIIFVLYLLFAITVMTYIVLNYDKEAALVSL